MTQPRQQNTPSCQKNDESDFDELFATLDDIFIDIIQLKGFMTMLEVLEQFKDKKGRIDFDYIETYIRSKALKVRKRKDNVDACIEEIQFQKSAQRQNCG